MAGNYQAYMQSRGANNPQQPQAQYPAQQMQNTPMYENAGQVFVPSFGFREVDGLNGVNRYPVAPGNSIALKDANSMTLYVKSVDLSGALLPLRVFQMNEITQEYLDRETPVSRAEFNQLSNTLSELARSMSGMNQMLEDLTAPPKSEQN